MESSKKTFTKKTYVVSRNSYRIPNTIPAVMQSHKNYLRVMGYEEISNRYYMETAYHNFYMLNYTIEGKATLVFNNATYHLKKGDMVLLHKYPRCILSPMNEHDYDWKILFMHINGSDIKDMFNEIRQKDIVILHDFPYEKIASPFEKIRDELRNHTDATENRISAQIHNILLNIRDEAMKDQRAIAPPLKYILDYIHENYSRPIVFDDVAKHTFISKSHINSLFIQNLGTTPMQYVMHLRIQKAQEMLCTTDLTIKKIAVLCGFKDDRSMIYVFKTHCEMTPQQLRASMGKPVTPPPTPD